MDHTTISPSQTRQSAKIKTLQNQFGRFQKTQGSNNEINKYFPNLYEGKTSSSNIQANSDLKNEIKIDSERKRLYQASRDFQAIFIGQMLKAMRKNLNPESDLLFGGNRQQIFQDMLYDEYSKNMSTDPRFNLADQIYNQLSPSLGAVKNDLADESLHSGDTQQKYSQLRMQRELLHTKNKISTDQLFREEDWKP